MDKMHYYLVQVVVVVVMGEVPLHTQYLLEHIQKAVMVQMD